VPRRRRARGLHRARDVAAGLPWTRHEHRLAELDVLNAALAILETRAHLELLVSRGDLTRTDGSEGTVYAPTASA
jgi:hypothetical protein